MPWMDTVSGIRPGDVSPGFAPFVLDCLFFFKTLIPLSDLTTGFYRFSGSNFSRIEYMVHSFSGFFFKA
jgi:hypothetical protein